MSKTITVLNNGPLKVDGEFEIRDMTGGLISKSDKPVFLCRCGTSEKKPFCDGAHKRIEFTSEVKGTVG
ncbi:MAG: CDGSH iron-sulfur domain-containing protein [Chlorobiales bacterium]|jgi:CDGSH iron-sulfur domain-containing protein 3|nr:CDGSH iron-sulfur domain-containing protein [Chlorobiales bacterium]